MWKHDEAVRPRDADRGLGAATSAGDVRTAEKIELGKSVVIKGELSASEDLTLDGHVEGRVTVPEHILTIGPAANINASISARPW